MQLHFLISVLLMTALCNAENIIKIENRKVYDKLESPDYPQLYEGKLPITWRFEGAKGTQLKIQCDDFRLTESQDCTSVRLEIDDGTNKGVYCGDQEQVKVISRSNWFTVKFDGSASGLFSCFVKSMVPPEPKVVKVNLNQPYHIHEPKDETPFYDEAWHFIAPENQQVKMKCYINLSEMDPCYEEVLTIDLGVGPTEYCKTGEQKLISVGKEAKLRLELGSNGVGVINCIAQAFDKEIKYEPKAYGVASEEDQSKEYDGQAGVKGTTCLCGWSNKSPTSSRIIHGKETLPNEYPWMVAIKAHFGEGHITCGGSIITHRHVVTAAHCVVNMYVDMSVVKPEDTYVLVGVHDIDQLTPKETVEVYKAEKIYVRPEFMKEYTHDLALVVLEENIAFTPEVGPVCLSPKRIAEPKQRITIIGWGKTDSTNVSSVLLKAKTSVIDRKKCDINEYEICTRADGSATCTGDSGGPLSWIDPETKKYTLMSVVSYGDPDCVSTPSVSTDIAYFYGWIQEIIKATYPEEMTCIKEEN